MTHLLQPDIKFLSKKPHFEKSSAVTSSHDDSTFTKHDVHDVPAETTEQHLVGAASSHVHGSNKESSNLEKTNQGASSVKDNSQGIYSVIFLAQLDLYIAIYMYIIADLK